MGEEICDQSCYELSWTTTKVNVNINTTNERRKLGRDFYFYVFVLTMVLAEHIPITKFELQLIRMPRSMFK